ncbi:MAG TPA: ABC transporter permease [Acidocella sp.]|jgi:osmoprotectant transport system permease protein|nr:ABC transporter permease [Acidocella sp.]
MEQRFDRLGGVIALLLAAALASPFVTYRVNRIAAGTGKSLFAMGGAASGWQLLGLVLVLLLTIGLVLLRNGPWLRLGAAVAALGALGVALGEAATQLASSGSPYARIAPASGFWLAFFALLILLADAMVRLRLSPWARLAGVVLGAGVLALFLGSGVWRDLSVLKEYATRAGDFWREGATHLELALGSLALAILAGLPLGILVERVKPLRGPVLGVLNAVQTIPSIALFGMLIAPLAWLAARIPVLGVLGIAGIGIAPAFIALFFYSLLPMVANTLTGITQVSADVVDAARGMGLSRRQLFWQIELPLALPVILTGIRVVLVQNIGLATIAALIGGGGLGVFIFQGIGQTASDLILLGTIPTVVLALGAAVVMDALIAFSTRGRP